MGHYVPVDVGGDARLGVPCPLLDCIYRCSDVQEQGNRGVTQIVKADIRQKEIVDRLLQESDIKERTIYTGIDDCVKNELIERRRGISSGGHPTDLMCLTPKGEWAYTRLTGARPVASEYDGLLKAHKSEKHTGLILKTADHFIHLGNSVQRDPISIKLAGDHVFQPDLIVQKGDETFYIEVETGEKIDQPSLERKWNNALIAGGGRICVVAPKVGEITTIQSNIEYWAGEKGRTPRLFLTNLEALRKCQPGDNPWHECSDKVEGCKNFFGSMQKAHFIPYTVTNCGFSNVENEFVPVFSIGMGRK